ncbi:uncharacterized protein GGS25DRAFT_482439 [Hypoxylon fragiforme]|uniref:uncharacterized protein n=1 Tax=Hypoxylon fragiforme TaxID=63214 RepID=UPI0020C6A643|nr:uncharacterized protein GGS25DRAFT_482439 [Hypoxylon fragiforme]KAI2611362.1 hypothetical protein GGS25DRAFT_482439 [Hypoxylon fragiforme]
MRPIRLPTTPSRCLRLTPSSSSSSTTSPFLQTTARTFSSTPAPPRQKPSYLTVSPEVVPDYPYGRLRWYKQANQGLFAGSKIRFGNTVAEKYRNKSRTTWLPNRHVKRLWSPSLGAFIRTRLTARVLHTIDRLGGIDEYLLGSKARRIKDLGPAGWALRWKIIQTPAIQRRFALERAALGLPPKEVEGGEGGEAALPSELAAEGLTSEDVLNEVDLMLKNDEEFMIGALQEGEVIAAETESEAVEGATQDSRDIDFNSEELGQERPKEDNSKPL